MGAVRPQVKGIEAPDLDTQDMTLEVAPGPGSLVVFAIALQIASA